VLAGNCVQRVNSLSRSCFRSSNVLKPQVAGIGTQKEESCSGLPDPVILTVVFKVLRYASIHVEQSLFMVPEIEGEPRHEPEGRPLVHFLVFFRGFPP
jgi:hypothetical protein